MGLFSADLDVYHAVVVDPDDTERRYTIDLRRLDAGQHAKVDDILFDLERGEGEYRLALITAAIAGWDIDGAGAPTPDKIAGLRPEVLQQIWAQLDSRDVNPFSAADQLVGLTREPATAKTEPPAPADAAAASVSS